MPDSQNPDQIQQRLADIMVKLVRKKRKLSQKAAELIPPLLTTLMPF